MRRTWVKVFCDQWLRGSIRKETLEVRSVFMDLLTMAGDNAFSDPEKDGTIQLADDVGFTDQAIASILNVPLKTWLFAKNRLANHPVPEENRIEIVPLSQGFAVRILNWKKYQSDYLRQRPYREGKKEIPPASPKEKEEDADKEREGEGEGEEFVTKVTSEVTEKVTKKDGEEELPPIPKNLPFKIQDDLREKKHRIREIERLLQDPRKMESQHFSKAFHEKDLEEKKKEFRELIEDYRE